MRNLWTAEGWKPAHLVDPNKCVCGSTRGHIVLNKQGYKAECTDCKPNSWRSRQIQAIANRIEAKLYRHLNGKNRIVHRDVACRYLQRFGGRTFAVQTEIDDCEVYLKNANGEIIAVLSYLDKYPKPPADSGFADMPY